MMLKLGEDDDDGGDHDPLSEINADMDGVDNLDNIFKGDDEKDESDNLNITKEDDKDEDEILT